jgi:hypothetical protein
MMVMMMMMMMTRMMMARVTTPNDGADLGYPSGPGMASSGFGTPTTGARVGRTVSMQNQANSMPTLWLQGS